MAEKHRVGRPRLNDDGFVLGEDNMLYQLRKNAGTNELWRVDEDGQFTLIIREAN